MTSQLNISKNKTRQETPPLSNTPTHGIFESHSSVVQSKNDHQLQQPNLKTSLIQAEKYGHHLSKTNLANQSVPTPVQAKPNVESPVQFTKDKKRKDPPSSNPTSQQPLAKKPNTNSTANTATTSNQPNTATTSNQPNTARTRERHPESEGESDSEDPNIVYRSLRPDEKPRENGLKPPEGHNPDKTASQHITAGSKAKEKSPFVSTSRSLKVAGAWASKGKGGQVAKVRIPEEKRNERQKNGESAVSDLTNKEQASKIFPAGEGTSINTAKSSQEVLIHGGVPPEAIKDVYDARKIKVSEYKRIKEELGEGKAATYNNQLVHKIARTRAEKSKSGKDTKPQPHVLLHQSVPEEAI